MAQAVKDREGAVRQDRAAMEKDARWLYNDFQRGLAEAKRTGKPLLVVLRCVPCLSCAGIDAQVLKQAELDLALLLDQFVCVRVPFSVPKSNFTRPHRSCNSAASYVEKSFAPYARAVFVGRLHINVHEPVRSKTNTESEQPLPGGSRA